MQKDIQISAPVQASNMRRLQLRASISASESEGGKAQQEAKRMILLYIGKAKDLTYKELWLLLHFGRPVEPLEETDFSRN